MITCRSKSTLTTLVQFIIVSTVVIALFAVLMPTFVAQHNRAVKNVNSKMADLGRAMQQYSDDNDGLFPSGTYRVHYISKISLTGLGWAGQIDSYVPSVSDFDDGIMHVEDSSVPGDTVSYAYNMNVARKETASWINRDKTVVLYQVTHARAEITDPNEGACGTYGACSPSGNGTEVMLFDGLSPRHVEPGTGDVGRRPTGGEGDVWPAAEINGGSLYLLADGHVKWELPQDVSSGVDARAPGNSQVDGAMGRAAGTANSHYHITFSTK
jgi:hypothetical protein